MVQCIRGLIFLSAFGLTWHGVISVFTPYWYWKEIVLIFFGIFWCGLEIYRLQRDRCFVFPHAVIYFGLSFLLFGSILTLFSGDFWTSFIAFRYLGIGVLIFLIIVRIGQLIPILQYFPYWYNGIVWGSLGSLFFGIFAKFFDKFEWLSDYYSLTISSWVPYQTLPIYHKAGEYIRMQGASSGPIEFSHILILALILICFFPSFLWSFGKTSVIKTQIKFILESWIILAFGFGILQSFSRSAILTAIIILCISFFPLLRWQLYRFQFLWRYKIVVTGILISCIALVGVIFFKSSMSNGIILRHGSSDHISRPLQVISHGLQHPFFGNIGSIGPAARSKNLRENNNDTALIAENIWIDIFAQMGIFGLMIYLLFFAGIFQKIRKNFARIGVITFLCLGQVATIFDMTPVSLLFFGTMGWWVVIEGKTKIE